MQTSSAIDSKFRPWNSPASSRNLIFYKLIVPSIIHDKMLRIPDKVAKKIRNEISCVATLSVPDGRVWCVELKTIGHKIWFDTYWQGFVEHYSIREGHLLIFRYEGGSNFSIHIFDLNNSEINYMSKTHGNFEDLSYGKQCTLPIKEELIGNDSINILDSNPCLTRSSLKSNGVEQHDPIMKSNRQSLQNVIGAYDESIFGFNKESRNAASFYGNGTNKDEQYLIKSSEISLSSNRFVQNVRRKSDILSGNELRTSSENVGLHIQDEENLLPRFCRDIRNQINENEHAMLTGEIGLHSQNDGERRFQASNLQTKRVEPSEHESPAKRIKSNLRLSTRIRAVTAQEEQNAIDAAAKFTPSNPFCKVVLKPSCVYKGFFLYMPSVFCKEYMKEVPGMIRLQNSDGEQWAVRCINSNRRFMLSKGWVKYVKENNLEEGDVCIFELIQVKDTVLKVTIFRVIENIAPPTQSTVLVEGQQKFETRTQSQKSKSCTHEPLAKHINGIEMNGFKENLPPRFSRDIRNQVNENKHAMLTKEIGLHSQNHGERRFQASNLQTKRIESGEHEPPAKRIKSSSRLSTRTRAVTAQEEQNAIDAASKFIPSNPFCKVILKPSCVYKGFLLHMPSVFCKEYMKEVPGMIRLQNSDGEQWAVRCINYDRRFMLSKGWVKFVKDNNLEEGDVCIFELIQVKDTVLKVTIFRVIENIVPPTQSTVLVEGQQKFETRRQSQKSKSCTHEPFAKRINGIEMNVLKENFDVTTNTRALINQEKMRVIDAATNFKTNNPYCMVVMKPSFVSTRFILHMPFLFCKKYMHGVSKMIKLQDSEGKHWPVRYLVCGGYGKLSKGWFKFVRDNNLEEGDVCVFEIIQPKETVLRVTIFHVLEDTAKPQKTNTTC